MARPGVAPLGLAYLEILHGLWENEVIHLDLLRVQDITESYQAENGEIFALDHICFSMEKGEFLSIVGPSGCGKSTLLSIIAGLLPPSSGTDRKSVV